MDTECPKCGPECRFREQAGWNAEQVSRYVSHTIPFLPMRVETADAELGFAAAHTIWKWKPYEQRNPEHRADYDRLAASIEREGVKSAVIGWTHPETGVFHVLIGQRRVEIARRLGIETVTAVGITEDIRTYWKHDIERIKRHLVPFAGEWAY